MPKLKLDWKEQQQHKAKKKINGTKNLIFVGLDNI